MIEATDFDGAWKEAMEQFFRPFLEFCFPGIAANVDWTKGFEFLDKELEKVVRNAKLGKLLADKLVRIYCLDGKEDWLLIHVEVQSQKDKGFPMRMYQYYHRISDRYDKSVVSLAVLADEHESWRPSVYEEGKWGCSLRFEYLVCKLLDYNQTAGVLEASLNPIATVVAAHFAAIATLGDPDKRFNLKWQLTRRLYERGYTKQQISNLLRLIDWVLTLPEKMDLAFEEKVLAYEQENNMPFITSFERIGIEKGRQEGRLEGRQEGLEKGLDMGRQEGRMEGRQEGIERGLDKGRQEGQVFLIVRLLRRRWGTLAPELEMRLSRLSLPQLEMLGERILDFADPSALQRWLDDNANRVN